MTATTTIFQYAKSTNPDVLALVERNTEGWRAFKDAACAFASRHGAEKGTFVPSNAFGSWRIAAIGNAATPKPTEGRWKRGPGGRGWVPFKNSPLAGEMEAIAFWSETAPGYPEIVESAYDADFSHRIGAAIPFAVDGVAYVGFGFIPADDRKKGDPAAGGWVEITGSEFQAAVDAYNESAKRQEA